MRKGREKRKLLLSCSVSGAPFVASSSLCQKKISQDDHRTRRKEGERDEIKAFRSIKIKEIKSDKEGEEKDFFPVGGRRRREQLLQEIALSIKVIKTGGERGGGASFGKTLSFLLFLSPSG